VKQRAPKADRSSPRGNQVSGDGAKARGPKNRTAERGAPRGKPGADRRDPTARPGKPRGEKPRDARDGRTPGPGAKKNEPAKKGPQPTIEARHPKAGTRKGPQPTIEARHPKTDTRKGPQPTIEARHPKADTKKAPPPQAQARRPKPPRPAPPEGPLRSGSVALIGRANVGKSTLMNAALGTPLAIVSHTPQTTRDNLLGVLHRGNAELRMLDTPGLHKPKSELGRVMNHHAREAARAADVVVFVTALPPAGRLRPDAVLAPHPGDLTLLQSFKEAAADGGAAAKPVVLAINKVDLAKDKSALLPLIEAFSKVLPFAAVVPLAATRAHQTDRLLDEVAALLPEGPWQFGPDDLTDRPTRYFAAEYVREQILRATRLEVPHAAAVTIDRFVEAGSGPVEIDVTIHVERPGQKKILIGTAGEMLKQIGTRARLRVKELLDRKVILKTWVRVTPAWRSNAQRLAEMGYEKKPQDEDTVLLFAELPELPELDAESPANEASGGDHQDTEAREEHEE
jgi:GTP-binding protein Era